jgi:hypothetical protein
MPGNSRRVSARSQCLSIPIDLGDAFGNLDDEYQEIGKLAASDLKARACLHVVYVPEADGRILLDDRICISALPSPTVRREAMKLGLPLSGFSLSYAFCALPFSLDLGFARFLRRDDLFLHLHRYDIAVRLGLFYRSGRGGVVLDERTPGCFVS